MITQVTSGTREGAPGKGSRPNQQRRRCQVGRRMGLCPEEVGAGTHIVLRGATQAAGLALDALPAVGPNGCCHVHREL